jgi:hypothetical protein
MVHKELFILKMGNVKDVKMMMTEFSLGVTKEQLMSMYEEATADKFNVLTIDKETQDITKEIQPQFTKVFRSQGILIPDY